MKKLFLFVMITVFSGFALNSCIVSILSEKGSGNVVRNERAVDSFTSVNLSGFGNVAIEQGNRFLLYVETDDNLYEFVETNVKNGELTIKNSKAISPTTMNIYILMPKLEGISIFGSGDVVSKYPLSSDNLKIQVKGSGNVVLSSIKVDNLEASISGSGDINLSGSADSAKLRIAGSGDMNFKNLTIGKCEAKIIGSGDIFVTATDELISSIIGSGNLTYFGLNGAASHSGIGSGKLIKGK